MSIKILAVGAALSTLVVGGSALAQTSARTSAAIGPAQPIPYSQLKAYSKASPKVRASKDWSAVSASTGTSVDTSATAPMTSGTMSGDAKASTSMDTSVNPAPNAMPSTPPILPGSATSPEPGSNLPASAPPLDPTMPK